MAWNNITFQKGRGRTFQVTQHEKGIRKARASKNKVVTN
jgi:hypothetical protein